MTTKRTAIPKSVKIAVWNLYIGGDKTEGKCYACNTTTIHITSFEAGHDKAVARGGKNLISNLRPICSDCNKSMQTKSIEWYKAQYFGETKVSDSPVSTKDRRAKVAAAPAAVKEAKLQKPKCPNCKGKGFLIATGLFGNSEVACPSCSKKGTVVATRASWQKCRKCEGFGEIEGGFFKVECSACKGIGIVPPTK